MSQANATSKHHPERTSQIFWSLLPMFSFNRLRRLNSLKRSAYRLPSAAKALGVSLPSVLPMNLRAGGTTNGGKTLRYR